MTAAGCFDGRQQVNVADDFLATAASCRRCCNGSRRDARASFRAAARPPRSASLSRCLRGIWRRTAMPSSRFGLRLLAEPVQLGDLARLAGGFELSRWSPRRAVCCSAWIFFGPSPGMSQHGDQAGRDGGLQLVVVGQLPGLDEFGDFLLQRFADAFDFAKPLFGDELCRAARSGLRACGRRWHRRGS